MAKVETSVTELKLNKLKKEQYDSIIEPSNTELYFVTDEPISYNDLSDKPNLKPVATSGSYDSLTEKPIVNGIEIDSTNKTNFGTSDTAAATLEKVVSIPSITKLEVGQTIVVQPTITSTATNSTLKLNDFPAYLMWYNKKPITNGTSSASASATAVGYSSNVWNSNFPTTWMFDGEHWVFLSHGTDFNTTYTINYGVDSGQYISGSGAYAVSRYSLIMQKPDMTWEKITNTSVNYTTATTKTVNTSGFLLNQIRYYNTTTNVANGAKIASNVCYVKHSGLDLRYSTNCGSPTTWPNGSYMYLVGAINPSDGLFYLDSTQWWSNSLPNSNDGKLYIRLGIVITANSYNCSLLDDRPIFYHDGTKLCEYKVADNKQDLLVSGTNIKTINNISLLGSNDIATNDLLPSQTGNTGKFLTTDGTDISWADVDAFPDQTGNAGKYLTTDGTDTSWDELATVANTGSYTDLSNKPTINDLTTTAQQNALNSNITAALTTQITTNQNDISAIQGKIPSAATTTNQLADKAFVNSTVTTLLARYITSSAAGDSFASNAALVAGPYYLDGTAITTANLNNNDYAMVMEDETHDNKPARYIWSGTQWSFQYVLNNTTFTQAQVDAMNSTITASLVNDYSTHIADTDIHVTTTDKNNWNAKQTAITGGASTITSSNLTASRALASNGSGKVAVSTTTSTELGYVHGVTSAIQTQLDSKALDSNTVHKTGNETIDGNKTFTNQILHKSSSQWPNAFLSKNTLISNNYTSPENDVSVVLGGLIAVDDSFCSYVAGGKRTNGITSVSLNVRNKADASGNNRNGSIGLFINSNGNVATTAPTPTEDTTSSTQIDTVGARNTKLQEYQTKLSEGTGISFEDNKVSIIQLDKTYTEIGSLTQSSEGVYSNFGPNAYVRLALGFTDDFTNGSGIFRVKTGNNLTGIQPILCDTATTQYVIGIVDGVPTFYNVENIVQLSATPLSTNTWYWFAITADENGDIYYSCIEDNSYTIETLPPFSQWTIYTFMLHDDFLVVLANTSLQVGKDFWNHVWKGEVDLKDSVAIVDGIPVWGYVDLGVVPAKASVDKFGLVRPDDTTITINDGIISYKNTNGYWTGNDVQNYRNKYITNCVTELPNDIKLEYSNNVLTIKEGSKLYYPNGANIFEEVVLENDETCPLTGTSTYYIFRRNASGTTGYFAARLDQISSGASSDSSTNGVFYNTTTNRIDWYEGGNRGDRLYSFPICRIAVSSGTITSIDRIFNGIGYIGSIVYATPGITVLIPNGRNEDNTLINIEKTTTSVSTYGAFGVDYLINYNGTIQECYNNKYVESEVFPTDMNAGFWYNIRENKLYRIHNYALDHQEKLAVCCHITTDNTGKAINIDYKYPFRATDYYDLKQLETKVNTNDSNVVHKTGNETIAGNKTFTGVTNFNGQVQLPGSTKIKKEGSNNVEGGQLNFEKGDTDPTIYDYGRFDLYNGVFRFFASCNVSGGGTEVRTPFIADFTNNRIETPKIRLRYTEPSIVFGNTSMDITQNNWTEGRNTIAWCTDKNGYESGGIYNRAETNNINTTMYAMSRKTGSNTSAYLTVGVDNNGNGYTGAPTPAAGDNSTKIATTNWISDATKSTSIVHRNGDETINGEKTFTGPITGRFRSASCHQGENNTNCWYKLGEFNSTGTYHNQIVVFRMWSGVNGNVGSVTGKIITRTGGGGTAGTVEYARIEFDNQVSWIDLNNFKLLYKASQGTSPNQYAIIELWVKTPSAYTGFCFSIQDERTSGEVYNTAWTFYNLGANGTASELPTEYTQLNAIYSDGAYVHIAGTETITGNKTFSGTNLFSGANTFNNTITSPKTTSTYLAGNQGSVIINSTAGAGSYTMLTKMNSTNGYMTLGTYQDRFELHYTAKSTVDAETNAYTYRATLLDESGNASFPNTITTDSNPGNYTTYASTDASYKKVATAGWVNNPTSGVNNIVHKSGDELVDGNKTFYNNVWIKVNDLDHTVAPNAFKERIYGVEDKNNKRIGGFGTSVNKDTTTVRCYMGASKEISGSNQYSLLETYIDASGNKWTSAPHPSASNSTSETKIATVGWVNDATKSTNVVHRSGDETIGGAKTFTSTITGTCTNALWADLAEQYESDKKYEVGTLIEFGGEKDITIASNEVNGVISKKPGFLLDAHLEDSQPVALVGKTPIRIIGKVNKHDKITLSEIPGVGRVAKDGERVIARALESSDIEEEKLVKCVTKFNLD